jgi:hypothetical protein
MGAGGKILEPFHRHDYRFSISASWAIHLTVSVSNLKVGSGRFKISKALAILRSRPFDLKCLALSSVNLSFGVSL